MVHLYSIVIIKNNFIINSAYDLSPVSFWQKSMVKEVVEFASKECAKKFSKMNLRSLEYQEYICYAKIIGDELAVACVTDKEYPPRLVYELLLLINDDNNDLNSF